MTSLIALTVAAVVVICLVDVVSPKVKVAPPLVLVAIGILVSLIPGMPAIHIEPDLVLEVILPPLLYASAVAMPAMSFRREFSSISGLSVSLVVLSSLVLGVLFWWLVPDLGFLWGVALGAILSPTDAVATSIIKGRGVPDRVVTILDGESLLNDATALVLLRTAAVSSAAAFSLRGAIGTFAYSVAIALAIGGAVGFLNFLVRRRITSASVNTILSFTLPFIASVPTEMLGGSGLVAAVVTGLIVGFLGPRHLPPMHRLTSDATWSSIQLVLEGVVFLTMGLQLKAVLDELTSESVGTVAGLGIALLALVVTLLVRAGWVVPMLRQLDARARRSREMKPRVDAMKKRLAAHDDSMTTHPRGFRGGNPLSDHDIERFATRLRRAGADIGYRLRQPLRGRDGLIIVWGGMRGAVTVAAAQTLPEDTPHRALLVFIAFTVATLSLLLQGGTIGMLVRRLFPAGSEVSDDRHRAEEEDALRGLLRAANDNVEESLPEGTDMTERRLAIVREQRTQLLDARDDGLFDADTITTMLHKLDALEMATLLQGHRAT